jgi:hypothetical protein
LRVHLFAALNLSHISKDVEDEDVDLSALVADLPAVELAPQVRVLAYF